MMTNTTYTSAGGRLSAARLTLVIALLASTAWIGGCDTTPGDTLYDDAPQFRADPVVTAVEPEGSSLAGIGTITIRGENFSSNPSENLVYFDGVRAEVVSASPTELVVRSPNVPGEDVEVRLTVIGAEHFADTVTYVLTSAIEEVGGVADFEESFAIATDQEGNVYVSLFANNASVGIKRIPPDGMREDYIPTTFKWDALAMKDDRLYGVRNVRAVFRFPEGGGDQEVWAVAEDRSARFTELTVDGDGNVWVGGSGGHVYRIDEAGAMEAFAVEGTVTALAAHEGTLYAARTLDGVSTVWSHSLEGGVLGAGVQLLALSDIGAGVTALSLAVAQDGSVFVGTNADDPLVLVEPDGTSDTFYPGLLDPPAFSLAWGDGVHLYMSRPDLASAPSRMLRINTQRQGPN